MAESDGAAARGLAASPSCSARTLQGLEKLDLAPRTELSTTSWGGENKYQVVASGRHIGVFVDYF